MKYLSSALLLTSALLPALALGCSTPAPPSTSDPDAAGSDAGTSSDGALPDGASADGATPDAPVTPDAGLAPDGTTCSSDGLCASGHCIDGVCCDTACDGTCEACARALTGVTNGTCAPALASDPEDECAASGCLTGACGERACELQPEGYECRAAADVCDVAELCDGASAACPDDVFHDASTVCRDPAGICDQIETCTGTSAACPSDTFASGTLCRAAEGFCDLGEACDGSSADCPFDRFAPRGTLAGCGTYVCGGANGACPTSCTTNVDCAPGSLCTSGGMCVQGWRMFVTNATYAATDVTNGDFHCRVAAMNAGLPGNYRAWYSTSTASASMRLYHPPGPIYRVDGTVPRVIANDWADLVDGISVAIADDEYGMPQRDAAVWTGTNDDGTSSGANCSNWTSTGTFGTAGNASAAAFSTYYGTPACTQRLHLYCLEQPPAG